VTSLAGRTQRVDHERCLLKLLVRLVIGLTAVVRRDVAANRAWVALGARPARPLGGAEVLSFDGLLIQLSQGESSGPGAGSAVDPRCAARELVRAGIEAAGLAVESRRIEGRESGSVVAPSGHRVELFEENAVHVGFAPDPGHSTPVAERHNRPLDGPVVPRHLYSSCRRLPIRPRRRG
jgi:hypothetical protein